MNNGKKCGDCNSYDGEWCWKYGGDREKDDKCVLDFSGDEKNDA